MKFRSSTKSGLSRNERPAKIEINTGGYLSRQMVSHYCLFKSERWLWISLKLAHSNEICRFTQKSTDSNLKSVDSMVICGFHQPKVYITFRPDIQYGLSNKRPKIRKQNKSLSFEHPLPKRKSVSCDVTQEWSWPWDDIDLVLWFDSDNNLAPTNFQKDKLCEQFWLCDLDLDYLTLTLKTYTKWSVFKHF